LKIGELPQSTLLALAAKDELVYPSGPFLVRLGGDCTGFFLTWQRCYAALELLPADSVAHYRIRMEVKRGLRRWVRPQVNFFTDGVQRFQPYPLDHAFPLFEWGLNWTIASTACNYLLLHSAVLEKGGEALVMPARPGSGKTTLCAALVGRGWRLLSDEFGILRQSDGLFLPQPRAAPLKNESIELLAGAAPHLAFGPRFNRTRKGEVVHLFPPAQSLRRQSEPARPRWVVFPGFTAGAALDCSPAEPIKAFEELIQNSFNYRLTGERGFRSLCRLMRQVDVFTLRNGKLEEAVQAIEALHAGEPA
jgi:HprK-related kinase A